MPRYYYTPGGSCKVGKLKLNDAAPGKLIHTRNSQRNFSKAASNEVIEMGVGLLPPNWLDGAEYIGIQTVACLEDWRWIFTSSHQ